MKEADKNVRLIFADFKGCPSIDMSAAAYDRLVNEVFNNNARRSIDFDEVAMRIRDILYDHVRECDAFSDWWFNHSTAGYYWRKGEMSIYISEGFVLRWIRISGLIKRSYAEETMEIPDDIAAYSANDVLYTELAARRRLMNSTYGIQTSNFILPKKIIHNNPATIVFWSDNTKTVAKCDKGDIYDPEVGFYVACAKKLFGNDYRAGGIIKTALEKSLKKGTKKNG